MSQYKCNHLTPENLNILNVNCSSSDPDIWPPPTSFMEWNIQKNQFAGLQIMNDNTATVIIENIIQTEHKMMEFLIESLRGESEQSNRQSYIFMLTSLANINNLSGPIVIYHLLH